MSRFKDSALVDDWYEILELAPGLFVVDEQDHVAFFVLRQGSSALFIDSGLGLSDRKASALLQHLGIAEFSVLSTHAHCDHVGLNYLAKEVSIGKAEWEKFLKLRENQQLGFYCEHYRSSLPWPADLPQAPQQREWKPTRLLNPGDWIKFGKWKLQTHVLPGHCSGHAIFVEPSMGWVFSGDLLISGSNYLHLRDSSIMDYIKSLKAFQGIVKSPTDPLLLPCHNQIPLDPKSIDRVLELIDAIAAGKIQPSSRWPASDVFESALCFEEGPAKIVIREDQLGELTASTADSRRPSR